MSLFCWLREGPDDAASLANSLVRAIDSPFNLDPMN
jgi:hypothetical protein